MPAPAKRTATAARSAIAAKGKGKDTLPTPGKPGDLTCWVCMTTTNGHIVCSQIPCSWDKK